MRRALVARNAEQVQPEWPSLAEPDAPDDEFIYWPN